MDEFIIQILTMYKEDRCNMTFAVNRIKSAMCEADSNAVLADVMAELRDESSRCSNKGFSVPITIAEKILSKYFR